MTDEALHQHPIEPPNLRDWWHYTWRRYTGRLKAYPELKGMGYFEYYRVYIARGKHVFRVEYGVRYTRPLGGTRVLPVDEGPEGRQKAEKFIEAGYPPSSTDLTLVKRHVSEWEKVE